MADEDDDLRINTLHQLTKHSPRARLDVLGHNVLPVGCGGVVLRWQDPQDAWTALLRMSDVSETIDVWLDGEPVTTALVHLTPGPHTIAVRLEPLTEAQPFALAATSTDCQNTLLISTQAGPDWRTHPLPPPEGWTDAEFDDAAWPPSPSGRSLVAARPRNGRNGAWQYEHRPFSECDPILVGRDGCALRGRFTVPHP